MGMSIQVNDFQWEPGKNDDEYIELLESSRDEWQKIAQKAIAKLKVLLGEPEPMVLTPSELQPDSLVWIEVPQSDEIWLALLRKTDWFGHPTWAMRGYALASYYLHDGYGRDWRCWSARPTDEQRRAVVWDDAE